MKKTFSILLTVFACTSIGLAQMNTSKTTEEEYNYMTKGYKMQLEGGLDMKKGYITDDPTEIKEADYSFKFIPLARLAGKDTLLVGYIVKAHSSAWDNTYWYGIPFDDEDLVDRCFNSIKALDFPMTQAFFKAYMKFETMEEE